MSNNRKYFGTDGIRGRVDDENLSPALVQEIGRAIGVVFGGENILVARDPRISGDMLQAALSVGICSTGVSVSDVGILPTPACAYLTKKLKADAGIVISASHNPYYDNGIKFFDNTGNKLSDQQECNIENVLNNNINNHVKLNTNSNHLGKIIHNTSLADCYIDYCKEIINKINNAASLDYIKNLKIVLDCSNGAMYKIAPEILSSSNLIVINNEPNGFNINQECGAACKQGLKKLSSLVREHSADLGIAFDGDGDRVILVSAKGEIIDGDQILYILACEKLRMNQAVPGLVGTLMSNLGLEQAMQCRGIDFLRAQVGDRYVLGKLLEKNWVLGGETSGHIINLDQISTGDGLIAALLIISTLGKTGLSLDELVNDFHKYPQVMLNIDLGNNANQISKISKINSDDILKRSNITSAVLDIEHQLANNGRLLVRKSGTEPLIRVMVEGDRLTEIEKYAHQLGDLIKAECASG
ncbi:MAG: phosphoglucosamine mutase [Gammaproteobacteria bacterium]|nr:phosphoglucosamine mutase [Gammaproteobacteria bacterium]